MKIDKATIQYIVLLLIVALLCMFISAFCFQLLLIQGESMAPTYHSGQLVLINKLTEEHQRGDCVLFYCESLECNLVKRIVAMPGDRVQIKDGSLFINGEKYLPCPGYPEIEYAGLAEDELLIPEGCCFVLGDNVSQSTDSRHEEVGLVELGSIRGKIIK